METTSQRPQCAFPVRTRCTRAVVLLALVLCAPLWAQEADPPPEDEVEQIKGIVAASVAGLYSISFNDLGMPWVERRRAIMDGAKRSWEYSCINGGGSSGYEP